MSQVSRYFLADKVKQEINSIFLETLSLLYKHEDILLFLKDFLSPTERIVLSKRITIALMLKQGYNYEAIKKLIKVSQATIADVNRKLKYSGQGYHKVLDRILREQKIKSIFDKIENFALDALTVGRGKGTGFWREIKAKKQQSSTSKII